MKQVELILDSLIYFNFIIKGKGVQFSWVFRLLSFHYGCLFSPGSPLCVADASLSLSLPRAWVSLCSLGCPRIRYVDHADVELTKIHLHLLSECWE